MSYSFGIIRAADKREALRQVSEKMDEVAASQPVHARDAEQVKMVAAVMVGLLDDEPQHDVEVSVSGYLSWIHGDGGRERITQSSVSVTASHQERPPA